MNYENEMGRKLLKTMVACILALAVLIGLPAGGSVKAESTLTLENNGYPYMDKNAANIIVGSETGTVTEVEWFEADSKDGEYTSIGQATENDGKLVMSKASFTSGKWYKAKVNDAIFSTPVMIYVYNSKMFITNGTIGYCWRNNGTLLDMIGQYNSEWIDTAYGSNGWELKTSSEETPAVVASNGGTTNLDQIYGSFFENNVKNMEITADIGEGQTAFSLGTDIMLGDNDGAPLTAVRKGKTITQIQIVDDYVSGRRHVGLGEEIPLTNAAFVIKLTGAPVTTTWLGRFNYRQHFANNVVNDKIIYNVASSIDTTIAGNMQCTDSGMTASWTGLPAGGTVSYTVSIGTVAETGASLSATLEENIDSITISDAEPDKYYRIMDEAGNSIFDTELEKITLTDGEGNVLTPDEHGWIQGPDNETGIVFHNLDSETTYIIQIITEETHDEETEVPDNKITNVKGATGINPLNPKTDDYSEYSETKVKKTMTRIQIEGMKAYTGTYKLYDQDENLLQSVDVAEGKAEFDTLTPGTTYNLSFIRTGKKESIRVPITTLKIVSDSFDYSGQILSPVIYDADTDSNLVLGTDYSGSDNISAGNAGDYTFDFEGLTDYYGSESGLTWEIRKKDLIVTPTANQGKAYGEADPEFTYTANGLVSGEKLKGALARVEGEALGEYAYTIGTLDSQNANYNITLAERDVPNFEIKAKDISKADIKLSKDEFIFNGYDQSPVIEQVTLDNKELVFGTDYTVESGNTGKNADTYTLTIAGTGNYTGTAVKTWRIVQEKTEEKKPEEKKLIVAAQNQTISFGQQIKTDDSKYVVTGLANGDIADVVLTADSKTHTITPSVTVKRGNEDVTADYTIEVKTAVIAYKKVPMAKALPKGKGIRLTWDKVSGADGYDIYASYCGKDFKRIKTIKGNKTFEYIYKQLDGKKLNLKKASKVYVKAYKIVDGNKRTIQISDYLHVAGINNKRQTNTKSIKLSKSKFTLSEGRTAKIKAKLVLVDKKKKTLPGGHAAKIRYVSSDVSVAKVNNKGKITAVGKGTCTVYVYGLDGAYKKVNVTVK